MKNLIKSKPSILKTLTVLVFFIIIFSFAGKVFGQTNCDGANCNVPSYGLCPDGVNTYMYSTSECPSTSSYHTCPDGINTYTNSQSECPSTSSYHTCPDGINIYINSTSECPAGNTINPYISPSYQQPSSGYTQPAYSYPMYSYGSNYGYGYSSYGYPVYPTSPVYPQMTQCWNGTYVSVGQSCPSQTQTCSNGQVI